MKGAIFPVINSKILLFGEYVVLYGGTALLMPYSKYQGQLCYTSIFTPQAQLSHDILQKFFQFLKKKKISQYFYLNSFEKDLAKGLFFKSTIPQGFGLGSSGALCAALYQAYGVHTENLFFLKNIFQQMEAYFHGAIASGIDPMVCFLERKILYKKRLFLMKNPLPLKTYLFLLNTKIQATTQSVQCIFEKKIAPLQNHWLKPILRYNNVCIQHFLHRKYDFWHAMYGLSYTTFLFFKELIPVHLHARWQYGLSSKAYFLKLCGSGGGGYILGFTQHKSLVYTVFSKETITFLN